MTPRRVTVDEYERTLEVRAGIFCKDGMVRRAGYEGNVISRGTGFKPARSDLAT